MSDEDADTDNEMELISDGDEDASRFAHVKRFVVLRSITL